jgi:hypothetical protein
MTVRRDDVPRIVSALLGHKPVRWSGPTVLDYDGRERTLEVFDADAGECRDLLRKLRPLRSELQAAADGPIVFVFHTRAESERLHSEFLRAFRDQAQHGRLALRKAYPPPPWVDVDVREGQARPPRRAA